MRGRSTERAVRDFSRLLRMQSGAECTERLSDFSLLSALSVPDLHRALEDEAGAAADEEGMDSTRL